MGLRAVKNGRAVDEERGRKRAETKTFESWRSRGRRVSAATIGRDALRRRGAVTRETEETVGREVAVE